MSTKLSGKFGIPRARGISCRSLPSRRSIPYVCSNSKPHSFSRAIHPFSSLFFFFFLFWSQEQEGEKEGEEVFSHFRFDFELHRSYFRYHCSSVPGYFFRGSSCLGIQIKPPCSGFKGYWKLREKSRPEVRIPISEILRSRNFYFPVPLTLTKLVVESKVVTSGFVFLLKMEKFFVECTEKKKKERKICEE